MSRMGSWKVWGMLWAFALGAWGAERPFRVAVFRGLGADPECVSDAMEALKLDPAIQPAILGAADIVRGRLDRFDALVLPGGGGARQMGNLGGLGQQRVLDFVEKRGKGIVGLCAGSYMLSDTPNYACFHLAGLKAIDIAHDNRGHGTVRWSFTPRTFEVFPEFKGLDAAYMQYFEGPVLVPSDASQAISVGTMESDVHLEGEAPAGMTPGKPLLAWSDAGRGRVFLSVGHPENTPGLRWMLPRMVRWTLKRPLIAYAPEVVRVRRTVKESLFDPALRAQENACFQSLLAEPFKGDAVQKRDAMARLVAMRSWGAKERLEGSLRDRDATVRQAAAEALVELEHTAAWGDVKAAADMEEDPGTRAVLRRCAQALRRMVHGR